MLLPARRATSTPGRQGDEGDLDRSCSAITMRPAERAIALFFAEARPLSAWSAEIEDRRRQRRDEERRARPRLERNLHVDEHARKEIQTAADRRVRGEPVQVGGREHPHAEHVERHHRVVCTVLREHGRHASSR